MSSSTRLLQRLVTAVPQRGGGVGMMTAIPTTTTTSTTMITTRNMATKKAGGSTKNGRDSIGRRLGIKLFPGQVAKPGSIIVRQRGQKFRAGTNVGMGKDHTIFAKLEGTVQMTRLPTNKKRNVVHVISN